MNRAALGIDLGGTNIKVGIVTEQGELLHEAKVATESWQGPDALLAKLAGIASESVPLAGTLGVRLDGVGIGTAGQVHRASGQVLGATATLPGWAGMPLGAKIREETGLPVAVDNDVNMIALGEAWHGAGREWADFLCIALGTGVGGCWIADRSVYGGRDGYAGEFGHGIIHMDGKLCSCGNKGCWEAYASVTALQSLARERGMQEQQLSPEELFRSARANDMEALEVVDRYCGYIAAGLTGLVHTFNPAAIVLGGAIVAGQGDFLLDKVRSALEHSVMPAFRSPEPIRLVAAELGGHAGVIGAAMAALKTAE
ncbi:ROK family protein [Paenibacillus sp. J5C_2022]|uniref:ROK family protein n=1 Tax=Paenibacillus sp. J5C2022 TaxID=2977129 RepID=UPI0021D0C9D7|nr:ROK family protein [Paenibacillus sp. J5C2022]MCU6711798.1 ROK family protein [Paenibacillus sp. J5C2022]